MRLNRTVFQYRVMSATILLVLTTIFFPLPAATNVASPTASSIDFEHSVLTVHVYRSGLFSFAGDNHEIRAAIASGTVDEVARAAEFTVDVREMRVLDPKLSADKRSQVQEKMLGPEVLDAARFPEIKFHSTSVEQKNGNQLFVTGELSLHGETRAIHVPLEASAHRFRGSTTLKQTDFGIKPISVGGGTIKVKDEVGIDFDITTRQQ